MSRPTSRVFLSLIAIPAAIIVSLSGCSVIGQASDLVQGKSDVFALTTGDCFNDEQGDTISSVKVLDCTEEHDNELYYEYTLASNFFESGVYDRDQIFADAEAKCLPEFESFVGTSADATSLNFAYLYPSAESWDDNDRSVQCVVYHEAPVSESLRNKGAAYPLS